MFKLPDFYYTIDEKQYFLYDAIAGIKSVRNNRKISYYNVPAAFDIETTSFLNADKDKCGCMYIWQFGINGRCIVGRNWNEFIDLIKYISNEMKLSDNKRIIVYVHNLQYEFQFMRKWFNWYRVFAIDERRPLIAVTDTGIEFRCSYLLSGLSLEIVGKNLQKYKVKKLVGNLDYNLMRHSKTILTDDELEYCLNDIRIVMAYIQELIESENSILNIPYTNTGFVRRYCKNETLKSPRYKAIIKSLTIETAEEYEQLKRAFQGGFTHANAYYAEQTLSDIASFDFTSSYPYVMLSEKFPMSKGRLIDSESLDSRQLDFYLKNYCCIFDIYFEKLTPRISFENYISVSRCTKLSKRHIANNGRVVQADYLETTITEQDFAIIKYCYNFEGFGIANFRIYRKDYLPTEFVKAILKLYADKTQLKGVEGKESEYLLSKGMLNSCYGMAVMDIVREEFIYNDNHEWQKNKPDILESLRHNNTSKDRFLFYAWGVYVTAYARRNLFDGIAEFESDYVYSDTDSLKVRNYQKHLKYIESYNAEVEEKLNLACKYHGISYDEMRPKNIKGQIKLIGIWDFEGVYRRFKTLGAKRYMIETVDENGNSKFSFTVAGCNKKFAIPYMLEKFGENGMFDAFDNYLDIPAGFTGKNTHIYIDNEIKGSFIDYQGNIDSYHELSSINLEKAAYSLFMPQQYLDYINGIIVKEY